MRDRHRPARIGEDDLYVKHARRLDRVRARSARKKKGKDDRGQHEVMLVPALTGCQRAIPLAWHPLPQVVRCLTRRNASISS